MRRRMASPRPRPRDPHRLGSLPSAAQAAHLQRELAERHLPANQARQGLRLYLTARAALAFESSKRPLSRNLPAVDEWQLMAALHSTPGAPSKLFRKSAGYARS
jgi:hypothetical protein